LGFFDDDRAALQDLSREFLNRLLGTFVGHSFDKGESARTPAFAVQRDFDITDLDAFGNECIFEVLLVDAVGKIANEEARTHTTRLAFLGLLLALLTRCCWRADRSRSPGL
jgi:hypothetical protein